MHAMRVAGPPQIIIEAAAGMVRYKNWLAPPVSPFLGGCILDARELAGTSSYISVASACFKTFSVFCCGGQIDGPPTGSFYTVCSIATAISSYIMGHCIMGHLLIQQCIFTLRSSSASVKNGVHRTQQEDCQGEGPAAR